MKKLFLIVVVALMAGVAHAFEARVASGVWFGCVSKSYYEELVEFDAQDDSEGFLRWLFNGLDTGHCVKFEEGERVFVTSTAQSGDLKKIRRRGESREYWTRDDAISK